MKKQTINVLLLVNTDEANKENKLIKDLEQFVPVPPTCGLEVLMLCTSELTDTLFSAMTSFNPDLICYYGLGQGFLWPEIQSSVTLSEKEIPLLSNNHDPQNLFYGEKYMYTIHFDKIKAKVSEIDVVKSRPSKLYTAKTKADLLYIKNRCNDESFGFDTETNFLNPFIKSPEPQMLCYSVAWLSDEEEGWTIPTNNKLILSGDCEYTIEEARQSFKDSILNSNQSSFIHNAAYDLLVCSELFDGAQPKQFTACTMLLLNLYHYASKPASLKENTALVGLPSYKEPIKEWIAAQPKQKGVNKRELGFEDVPLDIISPYAAMDAIAVIRIVNFLKKNMPRSLWKLYFEIPHKVLLTANELANEGYVLSRDRFNYTKFALEEQIKIVHKAALDSVKEYVTPEFNIASPKQLETLIFDKNNLNLPVFNKTPKGKAATSAKALDDLILFHPFIFQLFKLRKLQKLYSTYSYKGYAGVLNEGCRRYKKTGNWTMNAQYKQTNRTARLASSNFNGHNGVKKKGGNVLTLPSQGSMVKHYFGPGIVAEAENVLYEKIVASLSEEDSTKLKIAEVYNVDVDIKPVITKAKSKKEQAVNEPDTNSDEDT